MIVKIIAYLGPVVFLVFLISGCTTTPYGDQAISLEELEGVWKGYGDSQLATSRVTCTIKVPITFSVKDGRAISLCNDPRCTFDVPIKDNGTIFFKFKKALRSSSDYPGTQYLDISFEGQLSAEEGKGTFASGGCVGKWEVIKQTVAMQEAEKQARELLEQASRNEKSVSMTRKAQETSERLSPKEIESLFIAGSRKMVRIARNGWKTSELACSKDRMCRFKKASGGQDISFMIGVVSKDGTFSISPTLSWYDAVGSRKAKAFRKGDGTVHIMDYVYEKPKTLWIIDK